MKIIICGSMTLAEEMIKSGKELNNRGHKIILPKFTEEYAKLNSCEKIHKESVKNKLEYDLIREYFLFIKEGDATFTVNETRNGILNYIGGNSFLEMGFAHVLNKKIYLLNPIPNMIYTDEIIAMKPIVVNGDYSIVR